MSLLDDTLALVATPSISRDESALASHVFNTLRAASHLDVERIGDNVVAATRGHHARRVIVAGHLDTVPGDPALATITGDTLVGLGAVDMKGSLAVMLAEAVRDTPRSVEVTWVFYAREEIARHESGLVELAELRPDLLVADAALLGEPTGGVVEAGCQGTLRLGVTLYGARAHTARPFTGRNAIHRMGELITAVAKYVPRSAEVDGITYLEQLQVVSVDGGVAPNVVPDVAHCTLNHRVAPDRQLDDAVTSVSALLSGVLDDGDVIEVLDWAPAAAPSLSHDLIDKLVRATGAPPRAKVGWTDVATFAERGIPATNFGAGDPLLAHRSDEFITLGELNAYAEALSAFLA